MRTPNPSLFFLVWVSGCRLVLVFGTALCVVWGVSVFPFVCALLRRLFLGWAFLLLVSLVRSGKRTVALSPARTLCVVVYTQGTDNSDPRSFLQVPPAGKRSWTVNTVWDCVWWNVGGWTPAFASDFHSWTVNTVWDCVWSTSAVGPRCSRTPFRSCMEDRCSLLLALSISAHPPTPYRLILGATAGFFPFAVQVVVVVLGLRVFAQAGQPQLEGEARRHPSGMGRLSASSRSSTTICCTGCSAGTGFLRVPDDRQLFVRQCSWSLGAEERWQWRFSPVAFLTPHANGSHFCCPCTRVQSRSSELPATTVGESSRGAPCKDTKQYR